MKILVRAVISGFGFSLGAALFKKVSDKLGLGEDKPAQAESRPDPDTAVSGGSKAEEAGSGAISVEGI